MGGLAVRIVAWLAVIAALVLSLIWPMILGRSPIYFYDSPIYLFGGGSALAVLGIETPYVEAYRIADAGVDVPTESEPASETGAAPGAQSQSPAEPYSEGGSTGLGADDDYEVTMARSPYYGIFLAIAGWMHNLFLAAYVQVALVLVSGFFLLRAVFRERLLMPAALLVPLGFVTPLGIMTVLLLPDILAGLGILAVVVPFIFAGRLTTLDRLFWFVLLVSAVLVHNSHLAVALGLLVPLALLARFVLRQPWLPGLLSAGGAIMIGIASIVAFQQAVKTVYGYKPLPLPMVAAAVLLEEPGRRYLAETCPDNGFVYCTYRGQRPGYVDQWLWAPDSFEGVYADRDRATKRQMSEQQWSLLFSVLAHDPVGQIYDMTANSLLQLITVDIKFLAMNPQASGQLEGSLPPRDLEPFLASTHYERAFPMATLGAVFAALALPAAVLAVLAVGWLATRPHGPPMGVASSLPPAREMAAFGLALIAGVVLNAGVMGAFSQVQGRYEARVIWLLALFLALTAAWALRRRAADQ